MAYLSELRGTTSDPKFTPDVKGSLADPAPGLCRARTQAKATPSNQQQNPINNVMGLFNKKKQPK